MADPSAAPVATPPTSSAPAAAGSASENTTGVLTYEAGWETNGLTWSRKAPYRLAVGSYITAYSNALHVVQRDDNNQLCRLGIVNHYYPPTKLLFSPAGPDAGVDDGQSKDHLVTSGDYLRLWTLQDEAPATARDNVAGSHPDQGASAADNGGDGMGTVSNQLTFTFKHHPKPGVSEDFCAPLTSFDWSQENPTLVAACSIDTTVSLWDIVRQEVTLHLIAHDKEVFDVDFQARSPHVFATCGADGSVRVFDTRRMDHCTVVYETADSCPMLRVGWNKQDPNYIAAVNAETSDVVVFDSRFPSPSEGHLRHGHTGPINSFAWGPHVSSNLVTAGEDGRVLIWDTSDAAQTEGTSGLTYEAKNPLNGVAWSSEHPDWIAVTFGKCLQMLHV